jgi:hypothetical protein
MNVSRPAFRRIRQSLRSLGKSIPDLQSSELLEELKACENSDLLDSVCCCVLVFVLKIEIRSFCFALISFFFFKKKRSDVPIRFSAALRSRMLASRKVKSLPGYLALLKGKKKKEKKKRLQSLKFCVFFPQD